MSKSQNMKKFRMYSTFSYESVIHGGEPDVIQMVNTDQIILPCINVCTELPTENRFRLD